MIISNTSTLILISKVSLLSKYLESYGIIYISQVVFKEIEAKNSFENLLIMKEYDKGKIRILSINEKEYLHLIREFRIGHGEASIFALAKRNDNNLILTDDKKLINLCKIEQKSFTTAMAIVIRMHEEKLIDKETAKEKLDKLFAYGRYSNYIYDYFKEQVK